jgi:hypothetical protein
MCIKLAKQVETNQSANSFLNFFLFERCRDEREVADSKLFTQKPELCLMLENEEISGLPGAIPVDAGSTSIQVSRGYATVTGVGHSWGAYNT